MSLRKEVEKILEAIEKISVDVEKFELVSTLEFTYSRLKSELNKIEAKEKQKAEDERLRKIIRQELNRANMVEAYRVGLLNTSIEGAAKS